jgi:hypothetical protein
VLSLTVLGAVFGDRGDECKMDPCIRAGPRVRISWVKPKDRTLWRHSNLVPLRWGCQTAKPSDLLPLSERVPTATVRRRRSKKKDAIGGKHNEWTSTPETPIVFDRIDPRSSMMKADGPFGKLRFAGLEPTMAGCTPSRIWARTPPDASGRPPDPNPAWAGVVSATALSPGSPSST